MKELPYTTSHHIPELVKVLKSHGGYDTWSKMRLMSYKMGDEKHLIALNDRRVLITSDDKTIGYDGEDVWVYPGTADASDARFYHNLYFYFFAMPFVLGDPGINYEVLPPEEILGKTYEAIKVSYQTNVGDAPDDNYILYYDPDTYQMEWLKYTVTYDSGEKSDDYHLIRYNQWGIYNKLKLPVRIAWYEYDNGVIGEEKKQVLFENVIISSRKPDSAKFVMPDGARIAND